MTGQSSNLSSSDRQLLVSLSSTGAATPSELEIETGRIGDDLVIELDALEDSGLIDSGSTDGVLDTKIYVLNSEGRRVLGK